MSLFGDEKGVKCGICTDEIARYTCSRCSKRYCSLKCYKSEIHQSCSEAFYEKEVKKSISVPSKDSDRDKLKLIQVLDKYQGSGRQSGDWKYEAPLDYNKVEEELELNREDLEEKDKPLTLKEEEELKELIKNATPDQILSILTPEERQRFEEELNSGKYEVDYD